jgi:hypothetical protein
MSADVYQLADARAARDRRNLFAFALAVLLLAAVCWSGDE